MGDSMALIKIPKPVQQQPLAITKEFLQMLPVTTDMGPRPDHYEYRIVERGGKTYLAVINKTATYYPGIVTRFTLSHHALVSNAYIDADNWASIYVLFYEPRKGDYSNFCGFETDSQNLLAITSSGGVRTVTTIKPVTELTESLFTIVHFRDQTQFDFYIDSTLVARHTTNIPPQPLEIICCEPKANIRTIYLRVPPGLFLGTVW